MLVIYKKNVKKGKFMVRIKRGITTKVRHKKILSSAKGYYGRASKNYRIGIERVEKALQYEYRDRKRKKVEYHTLWIQRINSFSRLFNVPYSKFMHGLKENNIILNKKMLSILSSQEPSTFITLFKI